MDKKKILAVDDNKTSLKLLELRLNASGFSVITATDGEKAIELAKSSLPDLIVMDINMPGMDGGEAADCLKNDPETKHIPIIFLTSLLSKEEAAAQGGTIGGRFFLAKPFEASVLVKEIRKRVFDS